MMKLRIAKNSLKVIEKMEEVEILPIWLNQMAKNFETKLWIRKDTFLRRRLTFRKNFDYLKSIKNDL